MALNLAGVARDEVARGDVVVAARHGAPRASFRVDVALSWATPDARPDGGTRVAVHHGTRESPARLAELGGRYFQLRLEQPLVPARGDRVVIRSLAPPGHARRRRRARPRPAAPRPEPRPPRPPRPARARGARAGARPATRRRGPAPVEGRRPPALSRGARARAAAQGRRPRAAARRAPPTSSPRCGSTAGSSASAAACTSTATRSRDVTRPVTDLVHRDGAVTLASLRDELGTSRRYAQALLELLDAERVTLRVGDERVLRKQSG